MWSHTAGVCVSNTLMSTGNYTGISKEQLGKRITHNEKLTRERNRNKIKNTKIHITE